MSTVLWKRMLGPVVGRIANMISRGKLGAVDFSGAIPKVQIGIQSGELRQGVPFLQPQGFNSNPVLGRDALVLCFGGMKVAAHVVLVIDDTDRPTDLAHGESEIYAPGGARVVCRLDGAVEVFAPGGVTVHGDATVNGDVTATGDVSDGLGSMQTMRDTFNLHTHPQYSPGRVTHVTTQPMEGA